MKLENNLSFTGTQINYFFVCPRKLWFFSRNIAMEQTSDLVYLGNLVHEESYKRELRKVMIDNRIQIDFIRKTLEIHEVKKSRKLDKPHFYQLLYYLYYLKQKGVIARGIINYPLLRKREEINLTKNKEQELKKILEKITKILSQPKPPLIQQKPYCKRCSYYEFCYA